MLDGGVSFVSESRSQVLWALGFAGLGVLRGSTSSLAGRGPPATGGSLRQTSCLPFHCARNHRQRRATISGLFEPFPPQVALRAIAAGCVRAAPYMLHPVARKPLLASGFPRRTCARLDVTHLLCREGVLRTRSRAPGCRQRYLLTMRGLSCVRASRVAIAVMGLRSARTRSAPSAAPMARAGGYVGGVMNADVDAREGEQ